MHFIKMHGISNDYIYLDAVTDPALERRFEGTAGKRLVQAMSHRHTGIGSDGVILVCKPATADAHVRMRMFNADGSESEMCGNGIRCVAKFAHDRLNIRPKPMLIETGAGLLSIDYRTHDDLLADATVDMGEPILDLVRVPVDPKHVIRQREHEYALKDFKGIHDWCFVSMGNPHAVSWDLYPPDPGPDVDPVRARYSMDNPRVVLERIAPLIEHDPAFPNRTNVHIVRIISPREARMATWERGAGITQACGTGACAVLVASALTGRLERQALIHLPGGDLTIRWDEKSNHVFKTGPAADVFEGEWPSP